MARKTKTFVRSDRTYYWVRPCDGNMYYVEMRIGMGTAMRISSWHTKEDAQRAVKGAEQAYREYLLLSKMKDHYIKARELFERICDEFPDRYSENGSANRKNFLDTLL